MTTTVALSLHFTNPKHRIIAVGRLPNYDRKPWSSSIPDVCVQLPITPGCYVDQSGWTCQLPITANTHNTGCSVLEIKTELRDPVLNWWSICSFCVQNRLSPKWWCKSCQFFFYISREDYVNRLCWDQIRWLASDKFLLKPMDPTIYTAWEVHTSRIMSFLLLIFSNHFRQRLFWCAASLSQRPTSSISLLGEAPFLKVPHAHLTEEQGSKAIRAMPIYTWTTF